jgi:hypothetical protein
MSKSYRPRNTNYKFTPTGGPIDTPEESRNLFYALGLAVAAWARMEHTLTAMVMHVNKEAASTVLYEKDPPEAFRRKLKLLRKWLDKHPELETTRSEIDQEFFQSLFDLAEVRNAITHGFIQAFDEPTGEFNLKALKRTGPDVWKFQSADYNIKTLEALTDLSRTANLALLATADTIFATIVEQP